MTMSFSQRHGYTPVRDALQVESMDEALRNGLWNVLTVLYWNQAGSRQFLSQTPSLETLYKHIWIGHFDLPMDTIDDYWPKAYKIIRKTYFDMEWFQVYDFIEFIARHGEAGGRFADTCNVVLKEQMSGYRFVDGLLIQVTTEEELAAIEAALDAPGDGLKPVRHHLRRALELMSDRENPDHRNSIKESISAVEALCSLIVGKPTELGKALKRLEAAGVPLHPALTQAFNKLYGYTSDAEGIRHALMEEPTLTLADARFMLVTCSAFVSYLTETASTAGIDMRSTPAATTQT